MQQVEPWRKHLHYLNRTLCDTDIARYVGVTRQAVNKWYGAVRGPQKRHRIMLEKAYNRAVAEAASLTRLVEISKSLIATYRIHWKGNLELEEELELWPVHFMKARLPWLVSDDFFNEGFNRRGEYREFQDRPMFGWSDMDSQKAFRRDYAL